MTRQQQNSIETKVRIARCLLSQGNGQRLLAALEKMTAGPKNTKPDNNSQTIKHTNYAS
jgi:hypothetical protein